MVAVAQSSSSKEPAHSIVSRTSKASAEVVANIMQSLDISAPRINGRVLVHPATKITAQPPASILFNPSKSLLTCDSSAPVISLQVLKPATCTGSSLYAKEMALLANHVQSGLQARVAPIPIDDCTGGVYYLRTKNRRLTGVFKPQDEEAYAPNNPKQYHKPEASGISSMREGISAGDAAVREVAAYLLDHQHFARVPVTMLASIYHPDLHFKASTTPHGKTGALQAYVAHRDTADDVGSSLFNVAETHAIAILDIRLANQDRHGGNLLVVEPAQTVTQTSTSVVTKSLAGKKVSLVPIDHGACLPRISALSETTFLWLLWPQSKQPFFRSERDYIAALDAQHDLKLLEDNLPANYQIEREALLTLFVCTALLKFCALDRHMTAYDIGMLMCRQGPAAQQDMKPSVLETLVASCRRDPAVLKSEVLLKPVQKMATSSDKKTSQDKAWTSYVAIFMATFRRELVAHLAIAK
ncbi:Phosphatidylinositol 3- and 4-kinase [Phytophthora infestans]|uniref:Phosphatidylinositol 3- and 4-kinase n=1 Tax=Phytophthora infestans TaxID=4787 RepID=A0A833T226_PHYIN|nr:Phosphatidylinositol 3- and 4-kinase [Phytophthora infestans]KAF4148494.1 Phosphatidylinositol 3- and 4-kinase [Phytophthora infestans]